MPPPKAVNTYNNKQTFIQPVVERTGITTRSRNSLLNNTSLKQSVTNKVPRVKRKADLSPPKNRTSKRSALENITNAISKGHLGSLDEPKKTLRKPLASQNKVTGPATSLRSHVEKTVGSAKKPKPVPCVKPMQKTSKVEPASKITKPNVRHSVDLDKSNDNSLYVSALEDLAEENGRTVSDCTTTKENKENKEKRYNPEKIEEKVTEQVNERTEIKLTEEKKDEIDEKHKSSESIKTDAISIVSLLNAPIKTELPEGVKWDFDTENWLDPFQVSQYAQDIFDYLKSREHLFPIDDYMEKQECLSRWMRSLLVDWMVEIQESFELNHETLYLAVKLVDLYLTKVKVGKETLQLLGAASLFIASKYDERIPPMVEDFLYICDGAYTQKELIKMEINILKVVDFDLGIPLSYRFLRRYARCVKVSMLTLTLARYILEYSLMDYTTIMFSDSKMAAAALFLALQMKDQGGWTPILQYYTGYKLDELKDIINILNQGLHKKPKETLTTVNNKYSHKIFFEVAKVPLKDKLEM